MNNRQLHQSQLDAIVAAAKKRGMTEEQMRALVRQAQYENDSMYAVPSWNDPQMHALLADIAQETGIRMDYRGTAEFDDPTINANFKQTRPVGWMDFLTGKATFAQAMNGMQVDKENSHLSFSKMIFSENGKYLSVVEPSNSIVINWITRNQDQPYSYISNLRNFYSLDLLDRNIPAAERFYEGYYGNYGKITLLGYGSLKQSGLFGSGSRQSDSLWIGTWGSIGSNMGNVKIPSFDLKDNLNRIIKDKK